MSKSRIINIPCPCCGEDIKFEIFDSVNVTDDPKLKERVLTLDVFRTHCDKCGKERIINYPMLYHDMYNNFMVYLAQEEDIIEWQYMMSPKSLINTFHGRDVILGYTRRGVTSLMDFISKINILDKGLDDRIIEIIKKDCLNFVKEKRKKEKNRHKLLYTVIEQIPESDDLLFVLTFEHENESECYVIDQQRYSFYNNKYWEQLQYIDDVLIDEEMITKFIHDAKMYFKGMYQTDMKKLYCVYDTDDKFHLCLESIDLYQNIKLDDTVIIDVDGYNIKGKVVKIVEKSYYQLPKWGGHWDRIVAVIQQLDLKTMLDSDAMINDDKLKVAIKKHMIDKELGAYGNLLGVLNDSIVIMTFNAVTDHLDIDKILSLGVGGIFTSDMKFEKVLVDVNDKTYIPIYTSDDELCAKDRLTKMKYSFRQVLEIARFSSNIHGLIINPNTDKFILDNEEIRKFDKYMKTFKCDVIDINSNKFTISINMEEIKKRILKENVKYFRDVDTNKIVRKLDGQLELEYISKESPRWTKTYKDHSYEREYYFGQGNTCLFDISLEEVIKQFEEWELPITLLDD